MSAKHTGKPSGAKRKRASGSKKKSTAKKVAGENALVHSMVKPSGRGRARRTNWDLVRNMSDDDIRAGIVADSDSAPELDEAWFARAEVREPRSPKHAISFRVDPDVLEYFRSESPQYQSRMHEVLRAYVDHQRAKKAE
jgi:uncharacterized protein (DUF4415 family)